MAKPAPPRPTGDPTQVALYARVSTEQQADMGTIDAQRTYLHRYVTQHQLTIIDEYYDDGASGTLPLARRPEGLRLLTDAALSRFSIVLFYKVDRFGRNNAETLAAANHLQQLGVGIQSATEAFDSESPFGQFQFSLLSSLAQLNRDLILEQLTRGRDRRAADGAWGGGTLPLGYMVDEARHLVPSTVLVPGLGVTEAALVQELFARMAQGSSTVAEARRLNLLGIAPIRRATTGRAITAGRQWYAGRIASIIHNPVYHGDGTLQSHHGPVSRAVPPLVSPEVQAQVLARMTGNRSYRRNMASARLYLLRGLVVCGRCGHRLVGCGGNKATQQYYYRCPQAAAQAESVTRRCTGRLIRAEWLEAVVWAHCRDLILHPDIAAAALALQDQTQEAPRARLDAEATRLRQRLAGLQTERERLIDLYRVGGIVTPVELKRQFTFMDTTQAQADQQLAEITAALAVLDHERQPLTTATALLVALQAQTRTIENRATDVSDVEAMRAVLEILQPRIIVGLSDPEKGAGASQITVELFGNLSHCADSETVSNGGISATWEYSHTPQIWHPTPTEVMRARTLAAQAKVREAGGVIGRPSRFAPEVRAQLLADYAAGIPRDDLCAQYQVSRGYLYALLSQGGVTRPRIACVDVPPTAALTAPVAQLALW
jgi:site-specific DNA recombinase